MVICVTIGNITVGMLFAEKRLRSSIRETVSPDVVDMYFFDKPIPINGNGCK